MNRCPITYENCENHKYSKKGLRLLAKNLENLNDLPYTPTEQIALAAQMAAKLSIQGVQPKLSAKFNTTKQTFEVVENGGRFILKPPHQLYEELPQNEDLTMKLASKVGIEVPFHGMIYNIDGSLTYFIQRFDRLPKNRKLAVEDFSQLLGYPRETKYDASMEKVVGVIEEHCTFPVLEKLKLFRIVLFNFLTGNEDMHLKNFSLIRRDYKVEMSPTYDLLNTTIVLKAKEEIALPIRGKKSKLNSSDLFDYFAQERLGLTRTVVLEELDRFNDVFADWDELIHNSFLSETMREKYLDLIKKRWSCLE
ncbi:MAG: hypothetical protein K0S74_1130 [Chlamydiales bacterium]|jgi:serine/threonine-protein kinase HipA|nr:hypothetical protein [Chlamydiales bacterium]